mgnify:CR=1 FL=1
MATLEWIWSFVHTYNPSLCPFMVASYIEYAHLVISVKCTTQCHFKRGAVGSASDSWLVDTCQSWVRGGMAQWVARLTRDWWIPVSREFEPHQRTLLFPWARNFTLIAYYWFVPGTDWAAVLVETQYWLSCSTGWATQELGNAQITVLFCI